MVNLLQYFFPLSFDVFCCFAHLNCSHYRFIQFGFRVCMLSNRNWICGTRRLRRWKQRKWLQKLQNVCGDCLLSGKKAIYIQRDTAESHSDNQFKKYIHFGEKGKNNIIYGCIYGLLIVIHFPNWFLLQRTHTHSLYRYGKWLIQYSFK